MTATLIQPATILVITTHRQRQKFLIKTLGQAGHATVHAETSVHALELFNAHLPDVIILDAELQGEDAYQLAERLGQAPNGRRAALLMIVPEDDAAVLRAFAAGANECIGQLMPPILLRRRLENLLALQLTHRYGDAEASIAPSANGNGKYHDLFRMANDAIFVVELTSGNILDINRRAERWLGYDRKTLLEMQYDDLRASDDEQPNDKKVVEELSTRGHFIFEQAFRTQNGTTITAEVSSRIFTYGGKRAILNLVRDITQRKQLEQDEREQRQLATALIDAATDINATLEPDEVMNRILHHAIKVIHADTISVMTIDRENTEYAYITAHYGYTLDETARKKWHESPWPVLQTNTLRTMLETRQPLLINDVAQFPDWHDVEEITIRSYIGAPIIADGQVIGFLNVDHPRPGQFHTADASYLMAFANQAGIALENARLHDAVKQHADDLENRVRERTVQLTEANLRLKEQIVERQRAEDTMMEERNLLHTVINNLPDHIFVKDLEGQFIMVNDAKTAFLRANGFDGEIIGTTDYDYVDTTIADAYREREKYLIATGEPVINQEISWPDESDVVSYWLSTKVPLRDQNDEIIGVVGINRDVTALRAADAALKAEQTLLRTLFDHLPNEIYLKDQTGKIIMANRALINRIGDRAPGGNVVGTGNEDYVYDDHTRKIAEQSLVDEAQLFQSGEGLIKREKQLTDTNGEYRWFQTLKVPLRDAGDHVIGVLGINRDISEEKQAEERITQIITGARCLLWYAIVEEKDDTFTWDIYITNEEAAQTFLPLNVMAGSTYTETWLESIVPDDFKDLRNAFNHAIRAGETEHTHVFRCKRADGKLRWLNESVQIKPLTAGRYNVVGVVTDITERREAELTLRATNDLLEQRVEERTVRLSEANELLLEQIGERNRAEIAEREQRILAEALIATAAALSQTLDLNKVLDRILTYAGRVVPPHRSAEVLVIEDEVFARTLRRRTYAGDGEIKSDNNSERYLLGSVPILKRILDEGPVVINDVTNDPDWEPHPNHPDTRSYIGVPIRTEGRVIGFLKLTSNQTGQFTDDDAARLLAFSNQAGIAMENARLFAAVQAHATTLEERIAERTRELEYERAQLYAILNAMADGVIYHDTDHKPQYINQSLVDLTGYGMAEWLDGVVWPEQISADNDVRRLLIEEAMEELLSTGIWRGEAVLYRKNDELFDAQLVTTAVSNADGHFAGVVTVIRDVSAEKRLEAQKARFIATASHELRTPLTNMKTRLYLIDKQPNNTHEHLRVMNTVTNRMKKLVEDLLDLSRFENGVITLDLCEGPLRPLVEDVVEIQHAEAEKRQISLRANVLAYQLMVHVDESRMMQVLTNLVTNAINYTPDGGDVEVSMDAAPGGPAAPNGWAVIKVTDTGIGIAPDLLPEVFKPFFRANDFNPGMGLGLSITREIIALHNGEISVDSVLGEGTTFTVRLPLAQKPGINDDDETD